MAAIEIEIVVREYEFYNAGDVLFCVSENLCYVKNIYNLVFSPRVGYQSIGMSHPLSQVVNRFVVYLLLQNL